MVPDPLARAWEANVYDHEQFLRTLSEFSDVLADLSDVTEALEQLVGRVSGLLTLPGSGVGLVSEGRLVFGAASGPTIAQLERIQEATRSGPGDTAWRTGATVVVDDLMIGGGRWPQYRRAALALGIHAVAALPLRTKGRSVGALVLYARAGHRWDVSELAAAAVLVGLTAGYIVNASAYRQQVELIAQLRRALESRILLEQAKGFLAARRNITPDEAFEAIRTHARNHGATVRAIADAIVTAGFEPSTDRT